MAGLQEDNKSLKQSLSKVETERKQAQERSNNLEKVDIKSQSSNLCAYILIHPFCCISEINVGHYSTVVCSAFVMGFASSSPLSIGKEQPGNRPELQTEDPAATSGSGAD